VRLFAGSYDHLRSAAQSLREIALASTALAEVGGAADESLRNLLRSARPSKRGR
jgi:hypothetical protein